MADNIVGEIIEEFVDAVEHLTPEAVAEIVCDMDKSLSAHKLEYKSYGDEVLKTKIDSDEDAVAMLTLAMRLDEPNEKERLLTASMDAGLLQAARELFAFYNQHFEKGERQAEKLKCLLLLERYYDKKATKLIRKLSRSKNPDDAAALADANDAKFSTALQDALAGAYGVKNNWNSFLVRIYPHTKSKYLKKPKGVYFADITFADEINLSNGKYIMNGQTSENGAVFHFINRKRLKDEQFVAELLEEFAVVAEELNSRRGVRFACAEVCGVNQVLIVDSDKTQQQRKSYEEEVQKNRELEMKTATTNGTEFEIAVQTEKGKLLTARSCRYCGSPLNTGNDECKICGSFNKKDSFIIKIREEADIAAMNVVQCTQCGSSIDTSHYDGSFLVCETCGSSFILDKKALKMTGLGLDRKELLVDKPKDAEIPKLSFQPRNVFGGRINIIMPKDFVLLDEERKRIKYPRSMNTTMIVYTAADTTINLAFQKSSVCKSEDAEQTISAIFEQVKKMLSHIEFSPKEVLRFNGKPVITYNFISPAIDQDIYNHMFNFELDGHIINGSLNCLAKDRWYYYHIFKTMINSLRFNDNK